MSHVICNVADMLGPTVHRVHPVTGMTKHTVTTVSCLLFELL